MKRVFKVMKLILLITLCLNISGCQTAKKNTKSNEMTGGTNMSYEIAMSIEQWREFVSTELFEKAMGDYQWNTGEWKPLTDRMYAFDAEVFDIGNMYKLFLQGVQSIAADIEITDVREDLSGMTEELKEPANPYEPPTDGVRSVSFKCNGHEYSTTIASYGDWFNVEFISFMNQVLEKENKTKRLWILSDGLDQMIAIVYDSAENAQSYVAYTEKSK